MRVHGGFGEQTGTGTVHFFDNAFGGHSENGQEARFGADLRLVRAVTLATGGGVKPVNCAANVLPLRYFDAVWEDLDGQWIVSDFLSIGIQFRWGRILDRSHLLCSFP